MKIVDNNGKETSEAAAIKAYFGLTPGQGLPQFMAELKQLSPADKTELAVGAAQQLGWTVTQ